MGGRWGRRWGSRWLRLLLILGEIVAWCGAYTYIDGPRYLLRSTQVNDPFFAVKSQLSQLRQSAPDCVDLDGDGDADCVIGDVTGKLYYYQNSGTPKKPSFQPQGTLPLSYGRLSVGAQPEFVDIDGDGDLDLFVGRGTTHEDCMGGFCINVDAQGLVRQFLKFVLLLSLSPRR